MRLAVLASHLALVNVTLSLESNEKPLPKKNQREPSSAEIVRINRELQKMREFVGKMRSSPGEYARHVGYAHLFGLPELEPEKQKTKEEIIEEGFAAARRALASLAPEE